MSETKEIMKKRLEAQIADLQDKLASDNPEFSDLIAENATLREQVDLSLKAQAQISRVLTEGVDAEWLDNETMDTFPRNIIEVLFGLNSKLDKQSSDMINGILVLEKGIDGVPASDREEGSYAGRIAELMEEQIGLTLKVVGGDSGEVKASVINMEEMGEAGIASCWMPVMGGADKHGRLEALGSDATRSPHGAILRFVGIDGAVTNIICYERAKTAVTEIDGKEYAVVEFKH